MKLGDLIRQHREAAGLSQEALAHAADLGRNTISNLENSAPIRIDNLRKICGGVLKLSTKEWKEVLTLWLRALLGDDFDLYAVEGTATKLLSDQQSAVDEESAEHLRIFLALDPSARAEIMKAMERPEMIENIRALNRLYDTLRGA